MSDSVVERQLALRLSILGESDRAWVLSQVEEGARARLLELLGELDELGFRVDASMLHDIDAQAHAMAKRAEDEKSPFAQLIARIDGADVSAIRAVLEGEAPAVRTVVESAYAWQWLDRDAHFVGGEQGKACVAGPTRHALTAILTAFAEALETVKVVPAQNCASEPVAERQPKRWFKWLR